MCRFGRSAHEGGLSLKGERDDVAPALFSLDTPNAVFCGEIDLCGVSPLSAVEFMTLPMWFRVRRSPPPLLSLVIKSTTAE